MKYDYIFFTGSKAVGKQVMKSAAKSLTPLTLELGGKSPCIVDETADIPMAARRIVWGKFLNCWSNLCCARLCVGAPKGKKNGFGKAVVRNIEALYGESPLESRDYGKIINEKHYDRLSAMLEGETPYYSCGNRQRKLPHRSRSTQRYELER